MDTQELQNECAIWSEETFGLNGPIGSLNHLKEEIDELIEEINSAKINYDMNKRQEICLEFADTWMLLLDAARRFGLDVQDLNYWGEEKLKINKTRTWGEPDENGVVRHIK